MTPHAALEHRQSFFLALSDALRPLGDAGAIEREACRLLGDYLGADHTYYAEIRVADDWAAVRFDHARNGTKPLIAEYRLSSVSFGHERGERPSEVAGRQGFEPCESSFSNLLMAWRFWS